MKKKFSVALLLLTVAFSFLAFSGCSSGGNPYENKKPDDGYYIEHLNVSIDASAGDRSVRVIEEYKFKFNRTYTDEYGMKRYNDSHGFYRDLPLGSGEKIRDLKVYNAAAFSNVYEISYQGSDIMRVRVGSEKHLVPLEKTLGCTIEYTMITPEHAVYPDALVINAIGQGWTCEIMSANVSVKLPAQTNAEPQYFYGEWGSELNAVDDNVVSPQATGQGKSEYSFGVGKLNAYNGLTLYYHMPKGAFSKTYTESTVWFVLLGGLLLVGLCVMFKFLLGKSEPLAPVTNYYPPKHTDAGEKDLPMDPVDMGYLIDRSCEGSDVTSLIFYFASMGYLEIEEPKTKKSDAFKLRKLCDPPEGLPKYQYVFFNKIFSRGDEVTTSVLKNKMYTAVQCVQTTVKSKYSGKLYDNKARVASIGMGVLTVAYAILVTLLTGFKVSKSNVNPFGFVAVFPVAIGMIGISSVVYRWYKMSPAARWFALIGIGIVVSVFSLDLLLVTNRDVLSVPATIIFIASVALSCLIAPLIARKTKYYSAELNEVLGFKDFLQTAEKDRLETLLEENPQYYYDILPYANVLGVSDIWEDKFKNLTLEPPTYYRGVSVFDVIIFNRLYRSSYRAYSAAAVSRPSSSSRSGGRIGGGGGGGFSGGGFGGGGGGRW